MHFGALGLWAIFIAAAFFYTRRARHPDARPLAAYLIFVVIFTVISFLAFAFLSFLLQVAGRAEILTQPVIAALFLALVFVPAFFIARWQMRKPPRAPRMP